MEFEMKKSLLVWCFVFAILCSSCSSEDQALLDPATELVQADVFIRTVDAGEAGLKHAPAFFVYSVLPIQQASAFLEDNPQSKVQLNRIDDFTFAYYALETAYQSVQPNSGRYRFDIELTNGNTLTTFDLLSSKHAVPVILQSEDSKQADVAVRLVWHKPSVANAFKVKVYTIEGKLRYESDLLAKADTVFQVQMTDPYWVGTALTTKKAFAIVEAYLFENESVRLVDLQGVAVSAPLYFDEK
jgi:hypothetical protein